jgi:oxygen-independent coproporphyrinogen-3 oxidase
MRNRLGIYFHVPFCKQACTYCDFHFSTQTKLLEKMVLAQTAELIHYAEKYVESQVETIYLGGGTPSLMGVQFLSRWLESVHKYYRVAASCEITLEINPDDITDEKIQHWKEIGVNRFSVGIQSFDDEVLRWMNRAHSGEQSRLGLQMLQDAGFDNISVDLIYGHGKLNHSEWLRDVHQFISLQIPHISAYALTVEPRTLLHHQLQQGIYTGQEDEQTVKEFMHLHQELGLNGYGHYEVSNYAKPGFESKHNQSYWEGHQYLGIGPSAHSFDGRNRRYNVANNPQYIQWVEAGQWDKIVQWDKLDEKAKWNEMWLIGLRTRKGVNLQLIRSNALYVKSMDDNIQKWIRSEHLIIHGNHLTCTPSGWLVMDLILLDFFAVE